MYVCRDIDAFMLYMYTFKTVCGRSTECIVPIYNTLKMATIVWTLGRQTLSELALALITKYVWNGTVGCVAKQQLVWKQTYMYMCIHEHLLLYRLHFYTDAHNNVIMLLCTTQP